MAHGMDCMTNANRTIDIMMMALFSGKERRLEEWKAFFEQAIIPNFE